MISEMSMYRYTSIRAPARLVSSPTEKQRSYPRPNIRGGGSSGLQVFVQPIVSLCGDVFQCSTLETWSDFCQAYFGQVAESCLLRGDKSKASQSAGLESAAGRRKRERKENEKPIKSRGERSEVGEGEKAQPQAVENARSSSSGKEKEVQQSSL